MRISTILMWLILCASSWFVMGAAIASEQCVNSPYTNAEIISCSQLSLNKVDRVLNEQYRLLRRELDVEQEASLVKVQLTWITYRDHYCAEVYQLVFPGNEAPIESLVCLIDVTRARAGELLSIRMGYFSSEWYKSAILSNEALARNGRDAVIRYLSGFGKHGADWDNYAELNCKMIVSMELESEGTCRARMVVQAP